MGDRRVGGERDICQICKGEVREDLLHFVLDCEKLEDLRVGAVELQRPRIEDGVELMGNFLFANNNDTKRRTILYKMWKKRRDLEKESEEIRNVENE